MSIIRKPYQGVFNIIRFNWPWFLLAMSVIISLQCLVFFTENHLPHWMQLMVTIGSLIAFISILISLLVSYYIYDYTNLYSFPWLKGPDCMNILNVHAGFDETSEILQSLFATSTINACDFYDSSKHSEASIRRARKIYPPFPNTISVSTISLPFNDGTFNRILVTLSGHEIRDDEERSIFFKELNRITSDDGLIYVTEHLRDWKNFAAYSLGFLHFHSKNTWKRTFQNAHLYITNEIYTTPFITTFELKKNGNTV